MADIVIIVPKRDELAGVLNVFGVAIGARSEETLSSGIEIYRITTAEGLAITIALLGRQTNTNSGILTLDVIHRENPLQIYLVGTALGNPNHAPVASVFMASGIMDISERRPSPEDPYGWQPKGPYEHQLLSGAASNFVQNAYWAPENRRRFFKELELPPNLRGEYYERTIEQVQTDLPYIASELLLSGNEYIMLFQPRNDQTTQSIWEKFSAYRAYDMEAAGFRLAADSANVPWLVVRGASDHGTRETKADRVFAAAAAAKLLKDFIVSGANDLQAIRARRPRFAGTGMLRVDREFRGFMGYHDDAGNLVIYEDNCDFENLGNVIIADVDSQLIEGPDATVSLHYTADFTLAKNLFAAGTWAEENSDGNYFGSLSGVFEHGRSQIAGVWTGTHGQGIRVGRFRWYNLSVPEVRADFATRQGRARLLTQFSAEMESSGTDLETDEQP